MRGAGSLYLIAIGLLIALAGAGFTWLLWRSYQRADAQRAWPEIPCRILESGTEERRISPDTAPESRFAVLYGYEFEGSAHTSTRYSLRGAQWSKDPARARALVERFPEGSSQVCRVNPADPAKAVLRPDSKGPGYSLWFPVLFVVGGLGIAANAVRTLARSRPRQDSDAAPGM